MRERRIQTRVQVDHSVDLFHPSFGRVSGEVINMSIGGIFLMLESPIDCVTFQQVDAKIRGEGWDESMPAVAMEVIRLEGSGIALRFVEPIDGYWASEVSTEDSRPFL